MSASRTMIRSTYCTCLLCMGMDSMVSLHVRGVAGVDFWLCCCSYDTTILHVLHVLVEPFFNAVCMERCLCLGIR